MFGLKLYFGCLLFLALSGCEGAVFSGQVATDGINNTADGSQGDTNNDNGVPYNDANPTETAVAIECATNQEVPYEVRNGVAIVEGDINLGLHADVQAYGIDTRMMSRALRAGIYADDAGCSTLNVLTGSYWLGGIVPYTISPAPTLGEHLFVLESMASWEGKTNIRFVQRTNEVDYVDFRNDGSNACYSYIGRQGGKQTLNYFNADGACLAHEIGHVIGLYHEHNRSDRDSFIQIDFTNVAASVAAQFNKTTSGIEIGDYDFASIMHYDAWALALDRSKPVITPIDESIPLHAYGTSNTVSRGDILKVESVYGQSGFVNMRKSNSPLFAMDGGDLGEDGQNVYLWSYDTLNRNQHWQEIDRGDGYYSYKKRDTNTCLDGGNGGSNGQTVYLWECGDGNYNQHWQKIRIADNHRLQKRNAKEYSINGGSGGADAQDIYLWDSSDTNINQQWFFSSVN